MENQTKKDLEGVISNLAKKVTIKVTADDALKYTQAALNTAHTILVMSNEQIK